MPPFGSPQARSPDLGRHSAMTVTVESMPDERARLFDAHRSQLRAVGYRMLGSFSEADDAVQDAWFRFAKADPAGIANVGGWLTTVTSRICLDRLRQRRAHPEESLDVFVPDPIVTAADGDDPEGAAVLADSVGLALLVVLETLPPLERLAFVLHDSFGLPFDEIAPIVDRSVDATRQLASRARRRVQQTPALAAGAYDTVRQRELVDAWVKAAQRGDFDTLLQLLDPNVVLRLDTGDAKTSRHLVGATRVARSAIAFSRYATTSPRVVLINGAPGLVNERDGVPVSVAHVTVVDGKVVALDILADPERLARLDLPG
jgi:RNA polymerase sigma factor (sigma-70 family)